jgi:hypothetical protein
MKISSKNEFHSIVKTLCDLLEEEKIPVKTSRAQELLSETLGYKSANGLLAALPIDIPLTPEMPNKIGRLLQERHGIRDIPDTKYLLQSLERQHKSYSSTWNSDFGCYPNKISEYENYWYLTKEGWIPWIEMDFSKMRVELNIYKVIRSHFAPFLDDDTFTGSARSIWEPDIGTHEFQCDAERLLKKYGDMPERDLMFSLRYSQSIKSAS